MSDKRIHINLTNYKHGQVYKHRTTHKKSKLKYHEMKSIMQAKSNTVAASKKRMECWQKLAFSMNA